MTKEELALKKKKLDLDIKIAEAEAEAEAEANQAASPDVIESLPPEMGVKEKLALGFGNVAGLKDYLKKSGIDDVRKSPDGMWEVKKGNQWYSDESGFGLSDVGSLLPFAGMTLGGLAGAGVGAAESVPTLGVAAPATVPVNAMIGSAAGGGMGASLKNMIGSGLGLVKDQTFGEALGDASEQALIGASGELAGPIIKNTVGAGFKVAKPLLSSMSGVPIDAIEYAAAQPTKFMSKASSRAGQLGQDILSSIKAAKASSSEAMDQAEARFLAKYGDTPANRQAYQDLVNRVVNQRRASQEDIAILQDLVNPAINLEAPVFNSQVEPSVSQISHTVPGYTVMGDEPTKTVVGHVPGYTVMGDEEAKIIRGSVPGYSVENTPSSTVFVPGIGDMTLKSAEAPITEHVPSANIMESIVNSVPRGEVPGKDIVETGTRKVMKGQVPPKTFMETVLGGPSTNYVSGSNNITQRLFDVDPITGIPNRDFTGKDVFDMYSRAGEHTTYGSGKSDLVSGVSKQLREQAINDFEAMSPEFRNAQRKYAQSIRDQKLAGRYIDKQIPETVVERVARQKSPIVKKAVIDSIERVAPELGSSFEREVARSGFDQASKRIISPLGMLRLGTGILGLEESGRQNSSTPLALTALAGLTSPTVLKRLIPLASRYGSEAANLGPRLISPYLGMYLSSHGNGDTNDGQ